MRRILFFLAIAATCCFFVGCEDKKPSDQPQTETTKANEWVYSVMSANYLWSDQLPAKDRSGLTTATRNYFDVNLRYRQNRTVEYAKDTYGDRFSRIEKTEGTKSRAATEMDYDFGFVPVYVTYTEGGVFAFIQVLYVVPGSPAEKAGLRRGDAFDKISGQSINSSAEFSGMLNQSTISLKILNRDGTPTITINKGSYYDNPVLYKDILEVSGQNIGYLVYNHFTSGDNSGAGSYSTKLKSVFKEFKDAGVTKLILDLRYNGGGEVENARLLASLIIGSGNLGKTWMYMERNNHKKDPTKFEEAKFMTPLEVGGTKAEIDELFVITSDHTASASELIIHTLRPFYGDNLHVTGLTTVGKNLGSREFKKDAWIMHPITMRVYDKNKKSGYEKGIAPDDEMELKEYWVSPSSPYPNYYSLAPLGDIHNERLLNKVMNKYFGVPAVFPAIYGSARSAGQNLKAKADIQERGLTEPPQRMP